MPSVDLERIHTKGLVSQERNTIGPEMIRAIFSEELIPIFLGTSSPRMIVRSVTSTTISVCANGEATEAFIPHFWKSSERSTAIDAPENIPVRIPIKVIPICTVERKFVGLSIRSSTVLAVLLPFLASTCRLDLREFIRETSLIEKTPLSNISNSSINISIISSIQFKLQSKLLIMSLPN